MSDEPIRLGSGKLYYAEFTGTMPELSTIAIEANRIGYISGGAELTYTPTFYTAEDDLGYVKRTKLVKEEVILKTGVLTYDGNTLKKLAPTARVTETATKRIVKFGGLANDDGKNYIALFEHEDAEEGNVRVAIVGRNEKGFVLSYLKDKETIIDSEIKAIPHDTEGTLVIYEEDIPAA
jgi:hypothetical protein